MERPFTRDELERERRTIAAPPSPPDPLRCPECGSTYPLGAGGCYGTAGVSHGFVRLVPVREVA